MLSIHVIRAQDDERNIDILTADTDLAQIRQYSTDIVLLIIGDSLIITPLRELARDSEYASRNKVYPRLTMGGKRGSLTVLRLKRLHSCSGYRRWLDAHTLKGDDILRVLYHRLEEYALREMSGCLTIHWGLVFARLVPGK